MWNINKISPSTEDRYDLVIERYHQLLKETSNSELISKEYFLKRLMKEFGYKSLSHVRKILKIANQSRD